MKEKYLRIILYVVGAICMYVFIAVRIFPMMNLVLSEKMDRETRDFNKYGDLFYSNCINHFKQDFPKPLRKYRLSDKNPSVSDADILTFGDSFFDLSFHTTFPERLADTLNQRVYSFMTQDASLSNPFCILNHGAYPKNITQKYAIFETIERNIPVKFEKAYDVGCAGNIQHKKIYDEVIDFVFKENSEKLFALMLKRGYLVNEVYSFFVTLRFDLCGYISPMTGKYKMGNEPWLFYASEYSKDPGGFYYKYSDKEIQTYADNILHLEKNLSSNFNLKLIFMPVPNKYSIYHTMINSDQYSDFLPRLYAELDKRGVRYINLYREYKNSHDTLYYGTDTHWNKKGLDKALNLMLKEMNEQTSLASVKQQYSLSSIQYKN